MPRTVNTAVESNFINGLVTEATALNFPENACTDTDNCIFHPKGEAYRRYGLDFEPSYTTKSVNRTDKASSSYFWQNAAGLSDKNILVVQIGGILYFYAVGNTAVSQGAYSATIDISTYSSDVDTTKCGKYSCQYSHGQGYLIVVNPYTDPFYITYTAGTDSFSATRITVSVRDVKGLDEGNGLIFNTRPSTLTNTHKYNLWNQGWTESVYSALGASPVLTIWDAYRTDFPSNADVWWLFKDANDNFDYNLADKIKRGNSPAPKGFYTYSAWNLDRTTVIGGLPVETSGSERPRCVAFYAGRAWYAGVQAQGYGSRIYYTQTVKSPGYFGSCLQENDPTNQYLFSLLATDGGTIDVLDSGVVINLFAFQNMLLIFATNGIWAISGNQGIGFTPTDFSVKKLSSVPAISSTSFVDVDGTPVWWNNDGIYTVQVASPQIGSITVSSLTEKSIRTFYNNIPVENKKYAQGSYNPLTRQVQWVYRDRPITSDTDKYECDRALTYNTISKAFYPWTFPHQEVRVLDIIAIPTYGTSIIDVVTRDGEGDIVIDGNGESTITRTLTTYLSASVFKYLVCYPDTPNYKVTFAETYDTTYVDFKTYDSTGYDFTSYAVSGYALPGKANLKGQETYITVFCSNVDTSTVTLQGVWDYSNSVTSARYTNVQTIHFEGPPRKYFFRRLKIRGNGRTLQLRFVSVSGLPFNLSGWARNETINKAA